MSTDMITYLNYISTWDTESEENINKLIDEQMLFVNLGDFDSDSVVDKEFTTINSLAMAVRDLTIAADAIQIAADAAAVASIWSFGLGMAVFATLEAAKIIEQSYISGKSTDLNNKLKTVDTDISAQINPHVNLYVVAYKANNDLIAAKAPAGLDTKTCRSLLMQFLAQVHRSNNGKLDVTGFLKYAESARQLYNSSEIDKVYDALDTLNLSAKTDADIQQFFGFLKGLDFPRIQLSIAQNISVAIMFYKLKIANKMIEENAKAAGLDVEDVQPSAFEMLDGVGKFIAGIVVIMSVVDTVLEILDIVDVVEQCKQMCDQLNGPIKDSYKAYFNSIRTAAQKYKAAIATSPQLRAIETKFLE